MKNITKNQQPEIRFFPKILFRAYEKNTELSPNDTRSEWADVLLLEGGVPVIEKSSIIYNHHSIGHNTGRNTSQEKITFEQLPELIRQSKDSKAKKYIGMNRENWREYVAEDSAQAAPSKYSTMEFGGLEWYILDKLKDRSTLLLSKYGIAARPWNVTKEFVTWEQSTLCHWLNTDFVVRNFSKAEQQSLVGFGDNTKVTIPDKALLEKYLEVDSARTAKPSEKALQKGAWTYTYSESLPEAAKYVGNGLVWLKDHYSGDKKEFKAWIECLSWDGTFCMYSCDYGNPLVRPVIRVTIYDYEDIPSTLFSRGEQAFYSNYLFYD